MPTLQFKGKNLIWNHHLSVPYHSLQEVEELHFQEEESNENLIIEGDNLIALKSLLPKYAGKIKCIYIDPPYNTGKEDWIYSDKVNSPLIKEWLNKTVAKEDMTRHDKWLCMMVPRLKLLRDLLRKDGVIFISLDNNEAFNFKLIADEIFGEENFMGLIVVQTATDNNPTQIATEHEYVFCYSKHKSQQEYWEAISEGAERIQEKYLELKKKYGEDLESIQSDLRAWIKQIEKEDEEAKENDETVKKRLDKVTHYDNVDEIGVFHDGDIANTRFGGYEYEVIHPDTGKPVKMPDKGYRYPETTMRDKIDNNDIMFGEDETTLIKPKKRLETVTSKLRSVIYEDGRAATKELEKLFKKGFFKNPKSPKILKRLFEFTTEEGDIILDSFAGSGTTGQATMQLNKDDGGHRQFILIQMKEDSEDEPDKNICKDKTRVRVEKVIEEYNIQDGFKYFKVGAPIDPETMLQGELPTYKQFAEYIYYLATGDNLEEKAKINPDEHYVGEAGSQAVFLIYEQDSEKLQRLALTLQVAEEIIEASSGKRRIVYAPACFLDEEYMAAHQIEFVSIPYNLFERKVEA